MCLLGNNGSGKTTLVNLLTGLTPTDEDGGDITINTSRGAVSLRQDLKEFRSYIRLC